MRCDACRARDRARYYVVAAAVRLRDLGDDALALELHRLADRIAPR